MHWIAESWVYLNGEEESRHLRWPHSRSVGGFWQLCFGMMGPVYRTAWVVIEWEWAGPNRDQPIREDYSQSVRCMIWPFLRAARR